VDWGGEIDTFSHSYNQSGSNSQPQNEGAMYARLRPKLTAGPGISAYADILLRADSGNSLRNTARVDEAYVSADLGAGFRLRGGKIIYNWGNALAFNPTDFINPIDFYDFYHIDKLGTLAFDLTWSPSDIVTFQVGGIPVFEPSNISDSQSRWIDYSPLIRSFIVPSVSLPFGTPTDYTLNFTLRRKLPQSPQGFAKVDLRTLFFDFSLYYGFRYNPIPSDLLISSSASYDVINNRPTVSIEGIPYYNQEHVIGESFSFPALGAVLFADVTAAIPASQYSGISYEEQATQLNNLGITSISADDLRARRKEPSLLLSAGIRKEWSSLRLAVEYARVWFWGTSRPGDLFQSILSTLGPGQSTLGLSPSALYDFFSGSLIPGAELKLFRKLYLRSAGILNFTNSGYAVSVGLDYRPTDGLKVGTQFVYLNGPEGSLFRYFNGNTNLTFGIDLLF